MLVLSKKLLFVSIFTIFIGVSADSEPEKDTRAFAFADKQPIRAPGSAPAPYASYFYHEGSLQYIYLIGPNPDNTSTASEWWNTPGGFIITGDPNMASPLTVMGTATNSNMVTLSFISEFNADSRPVPNARRFCLARLDDGTIGLKDMTQPWTENPSCLWQIFDDGADANNVRHIRLMVPNTDSAPQFLLFADGALTTQPSPTDLTSVQFRIGEENYPLNIGF